MPAETGALYRAVLGARVGPPGLIIDGDLDWRVALAPRGGFLLEHAHLDLGVAAALSPIHLGIGPVIELEPAAFLVLRARLLAMSWFGSFDTRVAIGTLAEVGGQLRLAFGDTGPIIVSELRYAFVSSDAGRRGREAYHDLVLEPNSHVLTINAILGWRFADQTALGLRWERTASLERVLPRHTVGAFVHAPLGRWHGVALSLDALLGAYVRDEDHPVREGRPVVGATLSAEGAL
ncbi:MAG: hypothetical protein U1F43_04005 [Myxococcota bacterium]